MAIDHNSSSFRFIVIVMFTTLGHQSWNTDLGGLGGLHVHAVVVVVALCNLLDMALIGQVKGVLHRVNLHRPTSKTA